MPGVRNAGLDSTRMKWAVLVGMIVLALAGCGGASQPAASQQPAAGATEGAESPVASQNTKQWSSPPPMEITPGATYQATLHTNKGDIVIDLFASEDPITVNNFVFLAQQGFYTNVPFHRVIKGFMIQTGDPTGTGRGGPGYRFQDEKVTRDYTRGTVAMANAGPNTNGSQFFIVHGDLSGKLPPNYTIFGQVSKGMDVVDAIANVPVGMSPSGEQSAPTQPVTIQSVVISTQ